jgi:hypothetical protein
MTRTRTVLILATLFLSAVGALGQVATGTPPLGTFGGGPFDTINLGNLNVNFTIPIIHKSGRGLPFDYALGYDTAALKKVVVNGTATWQLAENAGWRVLTEALTGYVAYTSGTEICQNSRGGDVLYTYYEWDGYYDQFGGFHEFPYTLTIRLDTPNPLPQRPPMVPGTPLMSGSHPMPPSLRDGAVPLRLPKAPVAAYPIPMAIRSPQTALRSRTPWAKARSR